MANEFFGMVHQPLALPGDKLTNGAIYSLIPHFSHINDLPDPNIPNATWYAIASDFTDDGHAPPSLLRNSLNSFHSATYPAPQSGTTPLPPQKPNGNMDFNYMLGNVQNSDASITPLNDPDDPMHNDVIVTVDSQLAGSDSSHSRTFQNLSHTRIPYIGRFFPKLSNESVTNDSKGTVNQQITTWLGYQSSPSPTANLVMEETGLTAEPALSLRTMNVEAGDKEIFVVDDRLTVTLPDHQLVLGQPIQIPFKVAGGEIASVIVSQGNTEETFSNDSAIDGSAVGSGEAKVIRDDGFTKAIEFVPLQVGRVNLDIVVTYADGGVAHFGDSLSVIPSSKGLRKFSLNGAFSDVAIVLEDLDQDRQLWLSPEVEYVGLKNPIYLTDSTQIKLTVEQLESSPVIRLDPNGMIHGLRPGRAVITGEFEGVKDKINVDVYKKESTPSGYRHVHQQVNQ
jgi:hypothetical protein